MTSTPAYKAFCKLVLTTWAAQKPAVDAMKDAGSSTPNGNGPPPVAAVTYGLASGSGIQVASVPKGTGHVPAAIPGWSQATLDFDVSGNAIVGFTVEPLWANGTDGYWCLVSGGIGEDNAHFAFRSLYDRGLSYAVTVYTIDAANWGT